MPKQKPDADTDEGKLFEDDGRKAHDTERVGAVAPDTDPDDRPKQPPRAAPFDEQPKRPPEP